MHCLISAYKPGFWCFIAYHASPSLILTTPRFCARGFRSSDTFCASEDPGASSRLEGVGAPSPLISTFLAIAAVANGDKSFAITYLCSRRGSPIERSCYLHLRRGTYLTRGISFAYRIERRPVAESASRMTILLGRYRTFVRLVGERIESI